MYTPKFFMLQELLPKEFYDKHKSRGQNLWFLFDPRILMVADALRNRYGKMRVNNWVFGGELHFRGFRPFDTKIGSKFSQHKRGAAIDCDFNDIAVEEVRQDIISGVARGAIRLITCVELDTSWLHVDVRNWDTVEHGILTINP
jgi:hypothetical protein